MIANFNRASEHFLNALWQLQDQLQVVQRQLSSGVRIEKPSDAPDRIADVIRRQSQINFSEQVRKNIGLVKTDVDTAEISLQRAVKVIEDALVVGSQALSVSIGQPDRQAILAGEAANLHEELVRLSTTAVEGRFVFGGDDEQQSPYALNVTNPNGVDRLSTGSATRLVLDFDGSRFLAGRTAQEIFDHREADDSLSQDNAFAAVQSLRLAIESDDPVAIQASLDKLNAAHDYLNRQLAFYGSVQNRISDTLSLGEQREARIRAELSEIRDTDYAAAAVQLTQIQTNIEAAMRAQASTASAPNLFDFLR